ncbi:MAG: reverse transcriptase family protein [Gammaproteobacteria bacterium]
MITASPHLYLRRGQVLGVPDEVLRRALRHAERVEQQGLASILTLGHLAHRTGVPYQYLRGVVERRNDPYRVFEIRRRSGKTKRLISTPEPTLMLAQKWLVKNVLNCLNPHPDSYAYQPRRSVRACATRHLGARWLAKADLHDFFHSINERSTYRVFLSAGYSPLVSLELARLCTRLSGHRLVDSSTSREDYPVIPNYHSTYLGFLPQGAPTSGALANLVARRLDERLSAYAVAQRLVYTRYADDLIFSSGGEFRRGHAAAILQKVSLVAAECGFALHHRKSRIVPPGARKIVLGLLIDGDRIRIRKEMRSRIITHVRGVEKFGLSAHRAWCHRMSAPPGMISYHPPT